jgi:hypothetical protein
MILHLKLVQNIILRASLGTIFSQGFFIFPREISSFSLGKLEIPWKNVVAKLLRASLET